MPKKKVFHDSDEDQVSVEQESSDGDEAQLVQSGESGSDSDAGPEDVGFVDSKRAALKSIKDAVSQIEEEQRKCRAKRRQLDEKYIQQKKRRLERLANSRLTDDFMERLPVKGLNQIAERDKNEGMKEEEEDKEEEDKTEDGEHPALEGAAYGEMFDDELPEYIPFDRKHGIKAIYIKDEVKKAVSSLEAAAAFREQIMYGGSVPREATRKALAVKAKRRARFL